VGGPCYAGNIHEQRLAKSLPVLYAPSFTEVRLVPGRMAKAAALPDLRGKDRPDKPWLDGMPRMTFVSDMGDALSSGVPFEYLRDEVIGAVNSEPGRRHRWLWLTKLPHRIAEFARWLRDEGGMGWPDNLWAGTSITSTKVLKRIDHLLRVPAKVRFLSIEPQWEEIDINLPAGIPWVIQGGQSLQRGYKPRPFDLAWARSMRDRCKAAGIPYFLKQLGSHVIDGDTRKRLVFKDSHGGDWVEWDPEFRVREMPDAWKGASVW
jgi:protein gp37